MGSMGAAVALALAALAGACLGTQAGVNAQLGRYLGHPLWASFVSFLIGTILIVPLLVWFRVPFPSVLTAAANGPWWMWTGGAIGVCFVTAALILAPQMGVATFLAAMVAGQLIASLVIDHFGLTGLDVRPVTLSRILGAGLVFAGVLIIQIQR
jgi:bacterial/archaeal transporter family-2 protein